jgi:hypothetical protein
MSYIAPLQNFSVTSPRKLHSSSEDEGNASSSLAKASVIAPRGRHSPLAKNGGASNVGKE